MFGRNKINRLPLYIQIREYLLENINAGTWDYGHPIPSENELSRQFKVSRMTIKQALDALVKDGLVYRVQGRGTFISKDKTGEPRAFVPRAQVEIPMAVEKKRLIGYIAPRLNNMFMSNLLGTIEGTAAAAGYRLLFACTHDSQLMEEQILSEFETLGAAGIIVYPVEGELYNEAFLRLMLRRYPLVIIDRYLRGVETDCVVSDNFDAGRQAAMHLIGLGHKRIAFISHTIQGTSSVEDRLLGYESALQAAGIPISNELRLTTLKTLSETNKPEIRSFLEKHQDITAVIGVTSRLGRIILEVAEELGLRVPEDLSLVVFDNQEPLATFPTHIKQQEKEMAEAAVQLLIEAMSNSERKRTKLVFPVTLVVGKTSGPVRS